MRAPSGGELLGSLELLRRRRQPYADLIADVVVATLDRFPPPRGLPLVEIGSGTGQLREWLPGPLRERTIHTDPSGPALRALRERAPQARTRTAGAEKLPFADASTAAVMGLCVFDAIAEAAHSRVVAEVQRVLAPGGHFIHFADMATLLEGPFDKLVAAGLCPIPNIFGDPGDYDWPLDIVLIKRDWLAGLVDISRRLGHPLPPSLSGYFSAFLGPTFQAQSATKVFQALAASTESRVALRSFLESIGRASLAGGYPPINPVPFHSGRYLESLLESSFRKSASFRVDASEIVTRSRWRPRPQGEGPRYRSLCLGHQRIGDSLPTRLLGEPSPRPAADPGTVEPALVEAGVFVFVATREMSQESAAV